MKSRRLAFMPCGRWSRTVSKSLPVISAEEMRSAAAAARVASEDWSAGLLSLPSPMSRTGMTRHSVSMAAGEAVETVVFIMAFREGGGWLLGQDIVKEGECKRVLDRRNIPTLVAARQMWATTMVRIS